MKKLYHVSILISILLLQSCGYSPMLKNIELKDMKISKIEYSGVSDLIYFLRSNLNIPITKGTKDAFIVKISLRENASSVTKDTAGVTTQEKITISIAFEILDTKNNTIGKESITDSKTVRITNNISTDAEIKRVEKENIITNLIQQLTFAIRAKIISSQK